MKVVQHAGKLRKIKKIINNFIKKKLKINLKDGDWGLSGDYGMWDWGLGWGFIWYHNPQVIPIIFFLN